MSGSLRERWQRLGALPALPIVIGAYVVLFPVVLALGDPARAILGGLVVVIVAVYCLARPHGGGGVFVLAGVPALTSAVIDDYFGWPRETGLFFFPFAVALAWFADHPDEEDEPMESPRERS
jgi:hypothetical protein